MGLSSVMVAAQIHITRNLVDNAQGFISGYVVLSVVGLWVLISFFVVIFSRSNEFFGTLIDVSIRRNLTKKFMPMVMGKLNRIDYACFEDNKTHDIINRISRAPQNSVISCFNSLIAFFTGLFSLFGLIIYFMTISTQFTLMYIIMTIIYCALIATRTKSHFEMQNKLANEVRTINYLDSLFTQKHPLTELRVFGGSPYIFKKWLGHLEIILKNHFNQNLKTGLLQLINIIVLCIWAAFMLLLSGNMVINGEQSVGFFVAVLAGFGSISGIASRLVENFSAYLNAVLNFGNFKKFMELPEIDLSGKKETDLSEIRFEDVYFKYPNTENEILKGVSFTLKQDERISIVGKNGAGKSTIIKLLCGLYKPNSGKIYVGGVELSDLEPSIMRKTFSAVFQDFGQYSITLRENVALYDTDNMEDDEKIKSSLKYAMGEDLIKKSDLGLDVQLGRLEETGIDMSGGQWQRISIARAFFSDSKFIILDEPTASLDPLAECKMYEVFLNVLKNKGSITISHRLASAKMADRILVISNGKVTEEGSHDELMNLNREYRKMFDAQADWYREG